MRVNKFVLDANIWISYLISNQEQFLTHLVINHKVTFYYCDELITEIRRVLDYLHLKKYHIKVSSAINFIKDIVVMYSLQKPIKHYVPGDQDDDYIIALALQTNSGFVTSGDTHNSIAPHTSL